MNFYCKRTKKKNFILNASTNRPPWKRSQPLNMGHVSHTDNLCKVDIRVVQKSLCVLCERDVRIFARANDESFLALKIYMLSCELLIGVSFEQQFHLKPTKSANWVESNAGRNARIMSAPANVVAQRRKTRNGPKDNSSQRPPPRHYPWQRWLPWERPSDPEWMPASISAMPHSLNSSTMAYKVRDKKWALIEWRASISTKERESLARNA